jgi:dTDP-4-dehydrorhamnose reductase
MPRRAVVFGATGMVGRSWCGLLTAHGVPFRAFARPEIDLARPDTLRGLIEAGDELVVNAAAWTDVDGAEADEAGAQAANAEAPGLLAAESARAGATLIHYSTDYVFRGRASTPYPVDAPIEPVNAYGRSKAAGERTVRASGARHLIVRTSWVYAPWGKNFVRTIANATCERDLLRVVNDQRGRPTSAEDLAASSLALYLAGGLGTWHLTDGGECTWHGLACAIVQELGARCRVEPCTTEEFPRPATRPAYSVLGVSDSEALIGPLPAWRESLRRTLRRLPRQ